MLPADRLTTALWIGLGLLLLWLLAALSPILSPFLLAAILAYICNPLVERLTHVGLPRLAAVLAVLALLGGLLTGLLLIVLPLVIEEAGIIAERLPEATTQVSSRLLPWLREHFGIRIRLDADTLRRLLTDNWESLRAMAPRLLESLRIGGLALVGIAANLLLAPVVLFYLLMDWPQLLARTDNAIPRAWHAKTRRMAAEVDAVLAEFLRGQLFVMLVLAVYYSAALAAAGLPSALPVGIVTGLLVFVPYLGFALGLALALLVAVLEFQGWGPIVAVAAIYGVGQLVESFVLTPLLVGERIGLHPLAVIFALMAFGQLFGFVGVLLALPASAALLVGLRELRTLYLASRFYRGDAGGAA